MRYIRFIEFARSLPMSAPQRKALRSEGPGRTTLTVRTELVELARERFPLLPVTSGSFAGEGEILL